MNNTRRITATAILALLVFCIWSSVSQSHEERDRRRPGEDSSVRKNLLARSEPTPPDSAAQPVTPELPSPQTKPGSMSREEKLVRDVYARLMRYQSAARDELEARDGVSAEPEDYLTFNLRRIHTGPVSEIHARQLAELVTSRTGEVLNVKPNYLSASGGPAHAYYEVEWTTAPGGIDPTLENDPIDPPLPRVSLTVGQFLVQGGDRLADVEKYTSYEVTVHLNGKQRTYRALILHHVNSASDIKVNASARRVTADILDHITSEMNTVYNDESPRVRSPWIKYVKTGLYRAIARSIKEKKQAGQPLKAPEDPIGYLPGDEGGGGGGGGGGGEDPPPDPCPPTTVSITISGVANANKSTVGGLVVLNSDSNNAPRQQITVEQAQPASYAGNVTLTRNNTKVKLFTAATSGTEITFNGTDNQFANSTLPKSFYVEGATFSSAMRDVTLTVASDDGAADSATFTVLWVDEPTINFSGQISADNAARADYINWTSAGWDQLGLQTYTDDRFGWGDEASGAVHPSNFDYPNNDLKLDRDNAFHDWIGNGSSTISQQNFSNSIPPGNDTGPAWAMDTDPRPNGVVYDFDAAGLNIAVNAPHNQIRRTRNNFKAFASITNNGAAVRCSPVRLYFVIFSMQQLASPSGSNWVIISPPDVTGDNQAAYGTTRLTWNLQ